MSTPQFSRPGAFDLSALAASKPTPGRTAAGAPGSAGAYAVEITAPDAIAAIAEASLDYLVVLSLWSPRSPASVEVNDALGRLADAYAGRFLLATVDVDAVAGIAQAVGAQSVPYVVALLRGQPVAQIPPSSDEAALRQVLDQLVEAAVSNGITGTVPLRGGAAEAPAQEQLVEDPRFAEGDAALAAGDMEGAIAAYSRLVTASPADAEARERLAGVKLMSRTSGIDSAAARAASAADPADVQAQLLVADLDVVGGHVEDAFTRLIEAVRRTREDDRDRVRTHLLELFEVVGADDPRVGVARRNLAMALF